MHACATRPKQNTHFQHRDCAVGRFNTQTLILIGALRKPRPWGKGLWRCLLTRTPRVTETTSCTNHNLHMCLSYLGALANDSRKAHAATRGQNPKLNQQPPRKDESGKRAATSKLLHVKTASRTQLHRNRMRAKRKRHPCNRDWPGHSMHTHADACALDSGATRAKRCETIGGYPNPEPPR